jgi:hypothetical protein
MERNGKHRCVCNTNWWQRKYRTMGQQVEDDILCTLYFADGQIVIAEDKGDLSYMVRKLQEAYEQRVLTINIKNSELMIFGNNEKEDLPLDGDYISAIDKRKHLGRPIH